MQRALIARFLKAFGIEPRAEAIWHDRDGWPLSIGRGWFIADDGSVRLPRSGALIDRIAAAIAKSDMIRWVWVKGLDGRALLMRRYTRSATGLTTLVDVGGAGWRWRIARTSDLIEAQYNPHQPRYGKGGPRGGEFRATHGSAMRASLAGDRTPTKRALIGVVAPSTSALTDKIGVDTTDRKITLDHSLAVKILNKHGPGRENQQNQVAVTINDLFRAHKLLNRSIDITADNRGRKGRGGEQRFEARTKVGRTQFNMVFQAGRRDIVLVTMFKTKGK